MSDKITSAYKQSQSIYDDALTQRRWWSNLYIRLFWDVDDVVIVGNKRCAVMDELQKESSAWQLG